MGTKNNPGEFDCYEQADPDEPMFVLLGRDPHSTGLVKLWAYLRKGETQAAVHVFSDLVAVSKSASREKIAEALDCAEAMRQWRKR